MDTVQYRYRTPFEQPGPALTGPLGMITGVVVITSPEPWVIIAGLSLLLAGIWLEILQRFVFRIRFGRGDTTFRISAARALGRAASGARGPAALDESMYVEDFVRLFARLSVVTVLCYASVYCGLRNLTPDKEVFHGIVRGVDGNIGLLYFSTEWRPSGMVTSTL